jgi:hypothetical protein
MLTSGVETAAFGCWTDGTALATTSAVSSGCISGCIGGWIGGWTTGGSMAMGVSSSFGFITSSTFSSGRMDFLGRAEGKAKWDNLLAGRGAVLTAGLSLGFLAVTGDDFMGSDCCWAAATTTGTTERGAATGSGTTTGTTLAVWLMGITGEAAGEAGDGIRKSV